MPTARWWARAAVVNGKIYIIGGEKSAVAQSANEMYDPATNIWTTLAPIPVAKKAYAMAVANNIIYIIGGGTTTAATNSNYAYDPASNTWTSKANMPTMRNWPSAETANGKIYVFGGSFGTGVLTNNEVYDPASNTWSIKTALPVATDAMASEVLGNKIYLIAGRLAGNVATNSVQRYDVLSDSYATMNNYPISIWNADAAAVNSKIYVMGGYDGLSAIANHYQYDPGVPVPIATASDESTAASPLAAGFTSGWIDFDLKALVQEWVDGVRPNNGLVIYTEVADQFSINSRENSAKNPQLIVAY
jgi:N-acetylneuraminic acid mutarotase